MRQIERGARYDAPLLFVVAMHSAADGHMAASRSGFPLSTSLPALAPDVLHGGLAARRVAYLLMLAALALVATLPLVDWLNATWHDQQRVGQMLAMALSAVAATIAFGPGRLRTPRLLDSGRHRLVVLVVGAAFVSACFARAPYWGFVELALGVGSLGVAWVVATMRRLHGATVDRVLMAALFLVCAGLMVRFLTAYLAALAGGGRSLNAWLLVDGFSNPRFYGQFLTLALPVLLAPLLGSGSLRRHAAIAGVLAVLAWMVAITSGTRGTWLGLAVAALLLAWTGRSGRRWAGLQVASAVAGVALFWLALTVIPDALGIRIEHHAASRATASLSQRDIIWRQAIEVAIQHPLLGIGPMQLAGLPNGVAAHPHQAWLQWAAELGVPSALLVTWLVVCSARALFPVLRARAMSTQEQDVLRLCLTGALAGALTQSMVDGVLVMPYSQLWVALLGGWLLGLQPQDARSSAADSAPLAASRHVPAWWLAAFGMAVAVLAFAVVRDYPHLAQRERAFATTFGGHFQPRFWAQGVIAPAPDQTTPYGPIRRVSR